MVAVWSCLSYWLFLYLFYYKWIRLFSHLECFTIYHVGAFYSWPFDINLLIIEMDTLTFVANIHVFWTLVDSCIIGNHSTYPFSCIVEYHTVTCCSYLLPLVFMNNHFTLIMTYWLQNEKLWKLHILIESQMSSKLKTIEHIYYQISDNQLPYPNHFIYKNINLRVSLFCSYVNKIYAQNYRLLSVFLIDRSLVQIKLT